MVRRLEEGETVSELKSGGSRSLLMAGVAAVGASLCCVGPLLLLSLGVGGAWIGGLTALEPYRPIFIGITLLFLWLAFRRLYLVPESCRQEALCANPAVRRNQRILFWVVTVALGLLITFPWYGVLLLG